MERDKIIDKLRRIDCTHADAREAADALAAATADAMVAAGALAAALARAEKAERERDEYLAALGDANSAAINANFDKKRLWDLYAKAWDEIQAYRQWGYAYASGTAHDAARKEAGL